jgi:hypothetical protein
MAKFGGAPNFIILLHFVKGVDDGICQVNACIRRNLVI